MLLGSSNHSSFGFLQSAFANKPAEASGKPGVPSNASQELSLEEWKASLNAKATAAKSKALNQAADEYIASTARTDHVKGMDEYVAASPSDISESEETTEALPPESVADPLMKLSVEEIDRRYQSQFDTMRRNFENSFNAPQLTYIPRENFVPGQAAMPRTSPPAEGTDEPALPRPKTIGNIFSNQRSLQALQGTLWISVSDGKGISGIGAFLAATPEEMADPDFKPRTRAEGQAAYMEAADTERAALNDRIAAKLAEHGLEPAENETLEFQINLTGRITLAEGSIDADRAAAIEQALQEDESLGMELLLNHAKQELASGKYEGNSFETDAVMSRIVAASILKNETGLLLDAIGYDEATGRFFRLEDGVDIDGGLGMNGISKDYMVFHGLHNSLIRQEDGSFLVDGSSNITGFRYADTSPAGAGSTEVPSAR